MALSGLLLAAFFVLNHEAQAQTGPYYGLPIGRFDHAEDGTKGDVYASDPRTLMVVNFDHRPKQAGCTTYMVGPNDAESSEKAEGEKDGILLPVRIRSQGPIPVQVTTVASAEGRLGNEQDVEAVYLTGQRRKRSVSLASWGRMSTGVNHPLDAPFEFGNLQLSGGPNLAAAGLGRPNNKFPPFAGINLSVPDDDAGNANEWIGPDLPPSMKKKTTMTKTKPPATPPRAPVTKIRVLDFPTTKKMLPIAELMRKRVVVTTRNPARIYPSSSSSSSTEAPSSSTKTPTSSSYSSTEAPSAAAAAAAAAVIVRKEEKPKASLKMIVFNAEKGVKKVHLSRPTTAPSRAVRPGVTIDTKRSSSSTSQRRQSGQRRNNSNRRGRPTPKQPPYDLQIKWTPTLPYKRRGFNRSRRRTTTARRPRQSKTTTATTTSTKTPAPTTSTPAPTTTTTATPAPTTAITTSEPTTKPTTTTTKTASTSTTTTSSKTTTTRLIEQDSTAVQEKTNIAPHRPQRADRTSVVLGASVPISRSSEADSREENEGNSRVQLVPTAPPVLLQIETHPPLLRNANQPHHSKERVPEDKSNFGFVDDDYLDSVPKQPTTPPVAADMPHHNTERVPGDTGNLGFIGDEYLNSVPKPPTKARVAKHLPHHSKERVPEDKGNFGFIDDDYMEALQQTTVQSSIPKQRQHDEELPAGAGGRVPKETAAGYDGRLHHRFFPAGPPGSDDSLKEGDEAQRSSHPNIGRGLVMVDPNDSEQAAEVIPKNVHRSFMGPLPRYPELYESVRSEQFIFHDGTRRQTKPPSTMTSTTTTTTTTTPRPTTTADKDGWWVVPDPRKNNRKAKAKSIEPAETRRGATFDSLADSDVGQQAAGVVQNDQEPIPVHDGVGANKVEKADQTAEITSTTTEKPRIYATPKLPEAEGGTYVLPAAAEGETLMLELPAGRSLNEFRWFGIYDHCRGVRTASVSLRDIVPPSEAVVDGVKGWEYETGSEEIRVINCNTLLLRGFTYHGGQTGHNATESYVYVGTGDFPSNILQQVSAAVVGETEGEPLRNYDNEDVLVRLPEGWKTFDIQFVSIFNPTGEISYGHAVIPALIVPPCENLFN